MVGDGEKKNFNALHIEAQQVVLTHKKRGGMKQAEKVKVIKVNECCVSFNLFELNFISWFDGTARALDAEEEKGK